MPQTDVKSFWQADEIPKAGCTYSVVVFWKYVPISYAVAICFLVGILQTGEEGPLEGSTYSIQCSIVLISPLFWNLQNPEAGPLEGSTYSILMFYRVNLSFVLKSTKTVKEGPLEGSTYSIWCSIVLISPLFWNWQKPLRKVHWKVPHTASDVLSC
jgi:hypothetical protein